jgi:phospholipase C
MDATDLDEGAPDASEAGSCSRAIPDPYGPSRAACAFTKGASASDTVGVTAAVRATIPITHVVVITEENRSFDHFFGELAAQGQPGAEGWPSGFTNPDLAGAPVAPYHLTSTCLPADPPHQGADMSADWDHGKMNGFVMNEARALGDAGDGHFVMGTTTRATSRSSTGSPRPTRSPTTISRPSSAERGATAITSTVRRPTA